MYNLNKPKAIIFDCDDILLDYMQGIKKFIKTKYNIDTVGLPTDYVLNDWCGVSPEKMMEIIKDFNEQSVAFGLLEPLHYRTKEIMGMVSRSCKGQIDLIVLTKSGTFGHGEVLRKVNLINVFGDIFKEVIIIETYESKKGSLMKLKSKYDVLCFVDDYVKNIDDAVECGIHSVLLERTHNIKHKGTNGYNFFRDWIELYKHLDDLIWDNLDLNME